MDGIWTNDPTGDRVAFKKQLDTAPAASGDVVRAAMTTTVHADMMWTCGETEHWYCGSSGGSGYCETYYTPTYCDSNGGGGGYVPPGGNGGGPPGGTPPPPADPEVVGLQNQYSNCPPTPAVSEFIDSSGYTNPGHFTFDELRDSNYSHAIVTPALSGGLEATRTNYGSAITVTAGYRSPNTNAATPGSAACGDHTRGTAADLSIRNSTGAHDCSVWNALATAGHLAGAWVEPWSELVTRGTPDHVHLDFGKTANQPADYGTCNPAEVAP